MSDFTSSHWSLYITTITVAEVMFGVSAMPAGRRRVALQGAAQGLLDLFGSRVLPFGTQEALHYGQMAGVAYATGKRLPTTDGYIAAIAAVQGFSVATRDVKPFQNAGVEVINPWL